MALRIIFMGTPDFSVPTLEALAEAGHEIAAVYSQPPRPAGRRGLELVKSPVHQAAERLGIPVHTPVNFREEADRAAFRAHDADVAVVVAYGLLLPEAILSGTRLGCYNGHASLLPRWRGAAPIQRAILAGDDESGVDLMQMEAGLDTGPVLVERRTPIATDETGGSLHDRLSALGADALAEGLRRTMAGETLAARIQAETGVEYAHKLDKAEARLDFQLPAIALERKVRAFNPWPVAEADVAGERLRIWSARALDSTPSVEPGQVIAATRDGIDIACASGVLRLTSVQRPGGRPIGAADYLNARPELKQAAS